MDGQCVKRSPIITLAPMRFPARAIRTQSSALVLWGLSLFCWSSRNLEKSNTFVLWLCSMVIYGSMWLAAKGAFTSLRLDHVVATPFSIYNQLPRCEQGRLTSQIMATRYAGGNKSNLILVAPQKLKSIFKRVKFLTFRCTGCECIGLNLVSYFKNTWCNDLLGNNWVGLLATFRPAIFGILVSCVLHLSVVISLH